MFENKKVLLINTPAYDSDKLAFLPLAISYLAASLKKAGFKCDILDTNLENTSQDDVVKQALQCDFICISSDAFVFPYSDTYAFPYVASLASKIKSVRNIPIALMGTHATFKHSEIIQQYTIFDVIVRGEGETPVTELCRDFFKNNAFSKLLPCVTYLSFQGSIRIAEDIHYETDLNALSFPFRHKQEQYLYDRLPDGSLKIYIPVLTSRGCPYGCSYCTATVFKRKWTARSSENVAEEVYALYKEYGNLFIKFVDDNFYIDPIRAKEILQKIAEKCGKIFDFSFCTRADQIVNNGMENLRFFKDYGCNNIEIGIENGSDVTLKNYSKNTTVRQNLQAISMVRNAGMSPAIDFILFEPETTMEDLKANVVFFRVSKLWGYYKPLIYSRLFPLMGTIYEKYREINCDQYFSNANVYGIYQSVHLFKDEFQNLLDDLIHKADSRFHSDGKMAITKRQYLWLRTIPYQYFSELVDNAEKGGDSLLYMQEFSRNNNMRHHIDNIQEALFDS